MGYVAGKLSYHGKCKQKILQLENSQLADAIRNKGRTQALWSDAYVISCYFYCNFFNLNIYHLIVKVC